MLNRKLPRAQQCCGNCTAFIALAMVRERTPTGDLMLATGLCAAKPPVVLTATVNTRSVLDIQGPAPAQMPGGAWPATKQSMWCRDGWEFNPEVQVVQTIEGQAHELGQKQQRTN